MKRQLTSLAIVAGVAVLAATGCETRSLPTPLVGSTPTPTFTTIRGGDGLPPRLEVSASDCTLRGRARVGPRRSQVLMGPDCPPWTAHPKQVCPQKNR